MRGPLWRTWRRAEDSWFSEDEVIPWYWNVFVGFLWFSLCGPLLWFIAAVILEGSPLYADMGLVIIALSLVGIVAAGHRVLVACFLDITRGEVKEHNLWRAERLFLAGMALLVAAGSVAGYVLGAPAARIFELFFVVLALLVIGPLTVWAGQGRGLLSRFKPRIDAKFGYGRDKSETKPRLGPDEGKGVGDLAWKEAAVAVSVAGGVGAALLITVLRQRLK